MSLQNPRCSAPLTYSSEATFLPSAIVASCWVLSSKIISMQQFRERTYVSLLHCLNRAPGGLWETGGAQMGEEAVSQSGFFGQRARRAGERKYSFSTLVGTSVRI